MSKLFLGGIPTAPDVKKLREAFDGLEVGAEISHQEVEEITDCDRKSSRYRSVTTAWRKEVLRELNVQIESVPGEGFRILNATERLIHGHKRFSEGTRKQARSIRRVSMIPDKELTQIERSKRDHMQRIGAKIIEHATDFAKQLEAPAPQAQVSQLRARK